MNFNLSGIKNEKNRNNNETETLRHVQINGGRDENEARTKEAAGQTDCSENAGFDAVENTGFDAVKTEGPSCGSSEISEKENEKFLQINEGLKQEPDRPADRIFEENEELKRRIGDLTRWTDQLFSENEELKRRNVDLDRSLNSLMREREKLRTDLVVLRQTDKDAQRKFKSGMERNVQQLERTLTEILDRSKAELGSFRDSLEKTMYDTRFEIYKGDYSLLTDEYQKLFNYVVNVMPQVQEKSGPEWEKHCARLMRYTQNLKEGLLKAGLTVIYPQQGDLYDPNEHVAANALDVEDEGDIPIVSTVCPGFKKDGYVICRASVNLDMHNIR